MQLRRAHAAALVVLALLCWPGLGRLRDAWEWERANVRMARQRHGGVSALSWAHAVGLRSVDRAALDRGWAGADRDPLVDDSRNPAWGTSAADSAAAAAVLDILGSSGDRSGGRAGQLTARCALWAGDLERARRLYTAMVEGPDPADPGAPVQADQVLGWIGLGDCLTLEGQDEAAWACYRRARCLWRREAAAGCALRLVRLAWSQGRAETARNWLEAAKTLTPGAVSVVLWQYVLHPDGQRAEALRRLTDPDKLLRLGREPQLEHENGLACADLVAPVGLWTGQTLHRVIAARVALVGRSGLGESGQTQARWWGRDEAAMGAQLAALTAYLRVLAGRFPEDAGIAAQLARTRDLAAAAAAGRLSLALAGPAADKVPCEGAGARTVVLSRCMERWHANSHAEGLTTAVTAADYGYGRPGTWLWGPDLWDPAQGQVAFRADCLWESADGGGDQTALAIRAVDEWTGQLASIAVPPRSGLRIEYDWSCSEGTRVQPAATDALTGRLLAVEAADAPADGRGWRHARVTLPAAENDRRVGFGWTVAGCGHLRLDHLVVAVVRQ